MTNTVSEKARCESIAELRQVLADARKRGAKIGFVPTMGALHEGHLALIRECEKHCDTVVVSIFVNPLQFGPNEDFARYPRNPDADVAKSLLAGADVVFLPSVAEMYPAEQAILVHAGEVATRWEGALRPGHFDGVLTVVAKLFNIVEPDVSVFGQKDFQQALLVRTMAAELSFRGAIVVAPTIRDRDGLALSSRNAYLTPELRATASAIPRSLVGIFHEWQGGSTSVDHLLAGALSELESEGIGAPQYLAIVDSATLSPVYVAEKGNVVLVAARLGGTRLIDNLILDDNLPPGLAALH